MISELDLLFEGIFTVFFYIRLSFSFLTTGLYTMYTDKCFRSFFMRFCMSMARTDVLFVKMLQAISYNNNFIDIKVHDTITNFTDEVPHSVLDYDYRTISYVKNKTPFIFESEKPIKSGMISLVYLLCHKETKKQYILKVKRRNIENRLNQSIKHISGLINIITFFTQYFMSVEINNTMKRHLSMLNEQLDFENEIRNTKKSAENFKNVSYVRIPEIYDDYTPPGNNSIIMEKIPGVPLSEVSKDDYQIYCDLIAKHGFVGVIVHGFTHGDFHAGNILFIKNPKNNEDGYDEYQIGVIDFGLVITISEKFRAVMYEVNTKWSKIDKYADKIVHDYLNVAIHPNGFMEYTEPQLAKRLNSDLSKVIKEVALNATNDNLISNVFDGFTALNDILMSDTVKQYNVKMSDDFVGIQVALSMTNSVSMKLCIDDYKVLTDRLMKELFPSDLLTEDQSDDES